MAALAATTTIVSILQVVAFAHGALATAFVQEVGGGEVPERAWRPTPRPGHEDAPAMARWLLHNSLSGTVATQSALREGWPFAAIVSVSDGPVGASTGRVLFYIASISQLVADLAGDSRASFAVSEASFAPGGCRDTDPEWPLCAKATLLGRVKTLRGQAADDAADLIFARHPHMRDWAAMKHKWEVLELRVEEAEVISFFGGYARVNSSAYYGAELPLPAELAAGGAMLN